MWAHHPSAWTSPKATTEPQVAVDEKKPKKLSKRRKQIITRTAERLPAVSDDILATYLKFGKLWYLDREEAINMIEGVNFPMGYLRPSVWELCSRSYELLHQSPGVYHQLLLANVPNDESLLENILLDIERTLPCIDNFDQEKLKGMKNILIAYSVKDRVIGYAQGMNYLAASIIFLLPEEHAFWLLMRLMKGYSLEKLYPSKHSELHECLNKFEILLRIYMPDIQRQLQILGAELHYYVPQWFQTIFLYTQRVDLSIRVMDLLIIHGIQALFRVGLSIFALARDVLLSPDMSLVTAIDILKNLNLSILSTKDIIHGAFEYPNNLLIQTINNDNVDSPANESECRIS